MTPPAGLKLAMFIRQISVKSRNLKAWLQSQHLSHSNFHLSYSSCLPSSLFPPSLPPSRPYQSPCLTAPHASSTTATNERTNAHKIRISLSLSHSAGKLFGKKERKGREGRGKGTVMVMADHYGGTTFQIPDKNVLLLRCPTNTITVRVGPTGN